MPLVEVPNGVYLECDGRDCTQRTGVIRHGLGELPDGWAKRDRRGGVGGSTLEFLCPRHAHLGDRPPAS